MPSKLSRLMLFLKPTVYKAVGTIIIVVMPFCVSWLSNAAASTTIYLTYSSMSSQQVLRDLDNARTVIDEMQPLLVQLEASSQSIAQASQVSIAVDWAVWIIAAYLIAALLVERPALVWQSKLEPQAVGA